jgi:hypothetical protein
VVIVALVPWLLDNKLGGHPVLRVLAVAIGLVVVSVVTLLGVDVLWSSAGLGRPAPTLGLVVSGLVVTVVGFAYLRWLSDKPSYQPGWATGAALAALGLLVLTGGQVSGGLLLVLVATAAAIFVFLLQCRKTAIARPLWWALLLVGVAIIAPPLLIEATSGGRTSPALLLAGALVAAIVGINGGFLKGRNTQARWTVGTIVILAVALPLVIFAVVQAASLAPAATGSEKLPIAVKPTLPAAAITHRPILLFDTDERFRTPLNVDAMLRSGKVELCPQGNGLLTACTTLTSAADMRNGVGNLRFDSQDIQDAKLPTTIYAHAVPDRLQPGWTDIDYWWYLPDNPANTAQGAMCGAGLVIPEITCFDHQSDWEGVTVVVNADQEPVAVHYAAHNHVVNVPWTMLEQEDGHPRVFIARGSHAAYPAKCTKQVCNGNSLFEDNRYDGKNPWPCNGKTCVTPFPLTAGGSAASWNDFDGHWGSSVCVANVYCARSEAPKAPGNQGRYQRPWCYDYVVEKPKGAPKAVKVTGC